MRQLSKYFLLLLCVINFYTVKAGKHCSRLLELAEDANNTIFIDNSRNILDVSKKHLDSIEVIEKISLEGCKGINFRENKISAIEEFRKVKKNASSTIAYIDLEHNQINFISLDTLQHLKEAFPNLVVLYIAGNPLTGYYPIKNFKKNNNSFSIKTELSIDNIPMLIDLDDNYEETAEWGFWNCSDSSDSEESDVGGYIDEEAAEYGDPWISDVEEEYYAFNETTFNIQNHPLSHAQNIFTEEADSPRLSDEENSPLEDYGEEDYNLLGDEDS